MFGLEFQGDPTHPGCTRRGVRINLLHFYYPRPPTKWSSGAPQRDMVKALEAAGVRFRFFKDPEWAEANALVQSIEEMSIPSGECSPEEANVIFAACSDGDTFYVRAGGLDSHPYPYSGPVSSVTDL